MKLSTPQKSKNLPWLLTERPPFWLPAPKTSAKLFATGATVGPLVDSLHNQCLLTYNVAPIAVPSPFQDGTANIFCSSWTVLPLLGFAYVVLGGILPRLADRALQRGPWREMLNNSANKEVHAEENRQDADVEENGHSTLFLNRNENSFRDKAILAVITTALIIKSSQIIETHPDAAALLTTKVSSLLGSFLSISSSQSLGTSILFAAALLQWAWLDQSLTALLVASITAVGGPLSELPFVEAGVWEYIPSAADYFPLADIAASSSPEGNMVNSLFTFLFFGDADYGQLALASITGPCYFAVTMDAIALGRWFDQQNDDTFD